MSRRPSLSRLAEGLRNADRAALARAITLIESEAPARREEARDLIDRILPASGGSTRVGITGIPGVGKSTFIDALGVMLTGRGHRVAVLAVDPSSSRTGGSILGDKTRMPRLAVDPSSFIRPSPASGALGGVARMTREAMLLCEAAGFDVVLVETVGVGQSETLVADMVDFFLVLALPGAGDELQGIKKGVLELADMIAVNKADGDNRLRAEQAARHYAQALEILEPPCPDWRPPVIMISGLEGSGLDDLWRHVEEHRRVMEENGEHAARRRRQRVSWMRRMLESEMLQRLARRAETKTLMTRLEGEVADGRISPRTAVERLLDSFLGQGGGATAP